MNRRTLLYALALAILLSLPAIVADAANNIAVNQSGNDTQFITTAVWAEAVGSNISVITGEGNTTVSGMIRANVNYSMGKLYGRVLRDGISLGTINLTSSTYETPIPFLKTTVETTGTHYYALDVYCTAGRKCTVYGWNMSVMFMQNFDINASAQIGIPQVTNLQGTLNGMNSTGAVNDTNINTTIAELRVNDTSINSTITELRINDTNINATIAALLTELRVNDTSINSTLSQNTTELRNNDTIINASVTALRVNDTYFNSSVFPGSASFRNDSLDQGVRTTDSPTFVSVNSTCAASVYAFYVVNRSSTLTVCSGNGTIAYTGTNADNQTIIENAIREARNAPVLLRENITYVPSGDTTTAYSQIVCSGNTTILQPGNPVTTYLMLGAYSSIKNCGIKTKNTAGITNSGVSSGDMRFAYSYINNRNMTDTAPAWYPGKAFAVVSGMHGVDMPGISSGVHGSGDAVVTTVNDTGIGYRVEVNQLYPAESGTGMLIRKWGIGTGIQIDNGNTDGNREVDAIGTGIIVNNRGGGTGISIQGTANTSGNQMTINLQNQSQNGIRIQQIGGAVNATHLNLSAPAGFNGTFFVARVGTANKMNITSSGNITMTHVSSCIQMRSPDGTDYKFEIANGGTTSVTAGSCS